MTLRGARKGAARPARFVTLDRLLEMQTRVREDMRARTGGRDARGAVGATPRLSTFAEIGAGAIRTRQIVEAGSDVGRVSRATAERFVANPNSARLAWHADQELRRGWGRWVYRRVGQSEGWQDWRRRRADVAEAVGAGGAGNPLDRITKPSDVLFAMFNGAKKGRAFLCEASSLLDGRRFGRFATDRNLQSAFDALVNKVAETWPDILQIQTSVHRYRAAYNYLTIDASIIIDTYELPLLPIPFMNLVARLVWTGYDEMYSEAEKYKVFEGRSIRERLAAAGSRLVDAVAEDWRTIRAFPSDIPKARLALGFLERDVAAYRSLVERMGEPDGFFAEMVVHVGVEAERTVGGVHIDTVAKMFRERLADLSQRQTEATGYTEELWNRVLGVLGRVRPWLPELVDRMLFERHYAIIQGEGESIPGAFFQLGEERFGVAKGQIVIGSSRGADIRIEGENVEGAHALVRRIGSDWFILDAGTASGTRVVAGRASVSAPSIEGRTTTVFLQGQILRGGETIVVGEAQLTFVIPEAGRIAVADPAVVEGGNFARFGNATTGVQSSEVLRALEFCPEIARLSEAEQAEVTPTILLLAPTVADKSRFVGSLQDVFCDTIEGVSLTDVESAIFSDASDAKIVDSRPVAWIARRQPWLGRLLVSAHLHTNDGRLPYADRRLKQSAWELGGGYRPIDFEPSGWTHIGSYYAGDQQGGDLHLPHQNTVGHIVIVRRDRGGYTIKRLVRNIGVELIPTGGRRSQLDFRESVYPLEYDTVIVVETDGRPEIRFLAPPRDVLEYILRYGAR